MSRLESFIRRMSAQRDCLDAAAGLIAGVPGIVLELGLGNGRTYDHLRERLPDREIFAFDRQVGAHPDCIPDDAHFFFGEILEQLPRARERLGRTAALIHSDVGTGDKERNARLVAELTPMLAEILVPGGIVMADQEMPQPGWERLDLPEGVPENRYFMYRAS
ncbi:MAG: class I SAM-dependent methyltransferase [Alphaproteobacteria bacterium]